MALVYSLNRFLLGVVLCGLLIGCGTTKWSDTKRTGTEQLLVSDAMDRAVSRLDLKSLAGKEVYLDATPMRLVTDSAYLVSLIRQHMLASGCILRTKETEADYIVEARAGSVGTDRREVLFGVPSVQIPSMIPIATGIPSQIPEIPLAKKTDQRATVKIALFAFNRKSGRPLWQSGTTPIESTAKDLWLFGAGPFQSGTIHDGTNFAGDQLKIPLVNLEVPWGETIEKVSVAGEAYFVEPNETLIAESPKPKLKPAPTPTEKSKSSVVSAAHTEPEKKAPVKKPKPVPPPAAKKAPDQK